MNRPRFLAQWFPGASRRSFVPPGDRDSHRQSDIAARYRMTLPTEIQIRHIEAKAHMRGLLDACRDKDPDRAVACMRQFAATFRQIGLTRSVLLCPYLRWALQRDTTATLQFESAYHELMHSTLLIEAILTDYLGSPWDSDRHRRLVHVVVRLASLFSRGVQLETQVLLPLYLPPGQYRYVLGTADMEPATVA